MPITTKLGVAEVVLREGKPYVGVICGESPSYGPYSTRFPGMRWGRLKVEKSPGGYVWLYDTKTGTVDQIYSSQCVMASYYNKQGTLERRRAIRDALDRVELAYVERRLQ